MKIKIIILLLNSAGAIMAVILWGYGHEFFVIGLLSLLLLQTIAILSFPDSYK